MLDHHTGGIVMKRTKIVGAACVAMLAVGAPGASAAVDRTVYKCEGSGTWQVTSGTFGPIYADRSITAPAGACKKIHAGVTDEPNFVLESFDTSDAAGPERINLIGAAAANTFIGISTGGTTIVKGPIVISGNSLNATLSAANATPWTSNEIHTANGSCGANCYKTKAVWVGTYAG
jgi:hypothetical protein